MPGLEQGSETVPADAGSSCNDLPPNEASEWPETAEAGSFVAIFPTQTKWLQHEFGLQAAEACNLHSI